ncbi:MAG: cupin [Paenisporosarcina sp.]
MEIYRFDSEVGKEISQYYSNFTMTRIIKTQKEAQIGCMHLESQGIIGFHQAVVPQLLLIVSGEGFVTGDNRIRVPVKSGDAVFWQKGEGHETTTDTGLMAIVIESEELTPSEYMVIKK